MQQTNNMISDKLRLDGDSLVSICINRGSIDESEKYFKALSNKLVDKFYPELTAYLERVGALKQIHDCKTIKELEKLHFPCVPDDLPIKLATELDGLEELNDTERMFAFFRIFDVLMTGAFNHVQTLLHQRAEIIARTPKSKIITL